MIDQIGVTCEFYKTQEQIALLPITHVQILFLTKILLGFSLNFRGVYFKKDDGLNSKSTLFSELNLNAVAHEHIEFRK